MLRDEDFEKMLGPDGAPPLWPRAPRWYSDDAVKERLIAKQPMLRSLVSIMGNMGGHQLRSDERWRHLLHLVAGQPADALKPRAEWVALLLRPSGWSAPSGQPWTGAAPLSAQSFMGWFRESGMKMNESVFYAPPTSPPLVRRCDACDAECTSTCMCGESFCSRACLLGGWADHREICALVADNSRTGHMLTQLEMAGALSTADYAAAYGMDGGAAAKVLALEAGLSTVNIVDHLAGFGPPVQLIALFKAHWITPQQEGLWRAAALSARGRFHQAVIKAVADGQHGAQATAQGVGGGGSDGGSAPVVGHHDLSCCAQCKGGVPAVGKLKQCAQCHQVAYCGKACQKAGWKAHKKECAQLAAAGGGGQAETTQQQNAAEVAATFDARLRPHAQYLMGKMYLEQKWNVLSAGCGATPAKVRLAKEYFRGAAEAGHAYAAAQLGNMCMEQGSIKAAVVFWRKALALAAVTEAAYNAGVAFGMGPDGHPVDHLTASVYYERAASIDFDAYEPSTPQQFAQLMLLYGPNNEHPRVFKPLAKSNFANVARQAYPGVPIAQRSLFIG